MLTGKGLNWGGSLIRPEATGFGCVYFAKEMLAVKNDSFVGKTVAISGFGNVAWCAALKVTELGGKVVTVSGPDGYVYDSEGITEEKIEYMRELRATNEDIVSPYALEFQSGEFIQGKRPWEVKVDIALPCATQNELDKSDAESLVKKNPGEVEFHQAVHEVLESIEEIYNESPQFESAKVIERLIEPD
ncbi:MAG: hypothetical protein LC655_04585, partial [Bacteroidales bacterium]|nr:hypothetical protein [Bacteroidales bacterium]